jgi:hypothetical protein
LQLLGEPNRTMTSIAKLLDVSRSTLYTALPELQVAKRDCLAQFPPHSRPGPPALEPYDALCELVGERPELPEIRSPGTLRQPVQKTCCGRYWAGVAARLEPRCPVRLEMAPSGRGAWVLHKVLSVVGVGRRYGYVPVASAPWALRGRGVGPDRAVVPRNSPVGGEGHEAFTDRASAPLSTRSPRRLTE